MERLWLKEKISKLPKVMELVSIGACIVIKGCLNMKLLLYLLYHPPFVGVFRKSLSHKGDWKSRV